MPRSAAPRLGTITSRTTALVSPRAGFYSGYHWGARTFQCNPVWNGWWNCNSWSWCRPWGWNWGVGIGWCFGGFDPFCWNWAVLSPYWAFRTSYWNNCYQDCYWNSWCQPFGLTSSFWWYPRSTYCPTFLYVPSSSVVVVDSGYLAPVEERPAAEPVAADGGVVRRARGAEPVVGDADATLTLATKYVELGDFYFRAGRYEEAAEAYAKARSYVPNDASVHFVLADAAFANGDYHYAAFLIAEAVRLDPAIVTADVDKRTFYAEPREFEAQMAALAKYLADKPYDAWAHLVQGYNLRFSGESLRAAGAFARVLEIDRGNPTAKAFLDHLMPAPAAEAPAGR